jgi:pilus assembly protein CpaF
MTLIENNKIQEFVKILNEELKNLSVSNSFLSSSTENALGLEPFQRLIRKRVNESFSEFGNRLEQEYFGNGPLETLMLDANITEIIINSFDSIWFEQKGILERLNDFFLSNLTYQHFLQRFYLEIGAEPSLNNPFVDSYWRGARVHIVGNYQNQNKSVRITIRKHKTSNWTLAELESNDWCTKKEGDLLKKIITERKNFLVIGATGTGKTSVLRALLNECANTERLVIIEDTFELGTVNSASTHLITRYDSRSILSEITLTDLVKQSLRMRPDRIIIGEIRGGEAKDLLMALATGHEGSASTLHASSPNQALFRLEMLIQMGANHWSLSAIRKLLSISIDYLIICKKNESGCRKLTGVYKIAGVEETGLIIENTLNLSYS